MTGDSLAAAVAGVRRRPQLLDMLAGVYARLEAELAGRPACLRCGRCCDFAAFGHRLYVTALELALLARHPWPAGSGEAALAAGRCPYQLNGQCSAHERRTLGCRVFFCQGRPADEQALYERYHAELRALHDSSGVPYSYTELTAGLAKSEI